MCVDLHGKPCKDMDMQSDFMERAYVEEPGISLYGVLSCRRMWK